MEIIFAGERFACVRAIKDGGNVILCLTDGSTVKFSGVSAWNAFQLEDGEWSAPDITPEEQLRADVDYIAAMTGVSL